MRIEFTRLSAEGKEPTRVHENDAGFDLYAAEAASIGPGHRESVGTGIAVAIAAGHAGLVLPRSGLAWKHGIALVNSPGLIDCDYRGEIRVLLLNTDSSETFSVASGERIAQLIIISLAEVTFEETGELAVTARGAGGFGSTGLD